MTTNDYYMEKFGKIPNPKKQSELTWFQISKMLTDYHEQQLKILNIPVVSNLLCGSFEPDNKTSSATRCKCGREKWEHPKAT